ncbi:hypothetical protein Tco_1337225 [Tanacetum coccineum]
MIWRYGFRGKGIGLLRTLISWVWHSSHGECLDIDETDYLRIHGLGLLIYSDARILWEDLMDNEEAIETLPEVYGDDFAEFNLLVGMADEKKTKGFANDVLRDSVASDVSALSTSFK